MELTIGYHLLEGKMMDLKKPFAILEKQTLPADAMDEGCGPDCNTKYKVCTCPCKYHDQHLEDETPKQPRVARLLPRNA